ncbi:multidrug efflux RND transporter permease subunit [Mariniblastus sp.]|nr:multidrug efflux RND transporter permease subunit [Mariniblastus sp.]
MKFTHFFVDRPIFAAVLSIIVVVLGAISYTELPVSQYPSIALPTVVVRASYPGATPETIAETVATPLEQEINGVEDMIYMESQSTPDGTMSLTVTFAKGTDPDQAQVLVQNRISAAEARLPAEVRARGVTAEKSSPELLLVVHMTSPDGSRDQLYISNYAYLQVRDALTRLKGVGELRIVGGSQYSMRVWLDIEQLTAREMTAGEVIAAMKEQNIQVAAGAVGQQPLGPGESSSQTAAATDFQLTIATKGRLETTKEFGDIVVKSGDEGRLTRLKDVARVELGAEDYSVRSFLDGKNAVAMLVFARPGTNGVDTARQVVTTMDELSKSFPPGLGHSIVYNPMKFVEDSIAQVFTTLVIATLLVVLTVFVFLQRWQPTIIPVIAIPISLIGTFGIMQLAGFSLNNLSLFGLVLAIGVVVDDAIVVVENVERLIASGLKPKEATKQAMSEVGSALIATTLVLVAVFVPTSFLTGITGSFFRQFALTIAGATVISTFVSLTLTPAMCGLLLQPADSKPGWFTRLLDSLFGWLFRPFNYVFDRASELYGGLVSKMLRLSTISLIGYVGLLVATYFGFQIVPTGFIPKQDQGYLIVAVQLPDSASLSRTTEVVEEMSQIVLGTPGIRHAVAFAGFSGATRSNNPNVGACFAQMHDASDRAKQGLQADNVLADMQKRLSKIQQASIFVLAPPPVRGIGNAGGFKMQVQDRGGVGFSELNAATQKLIQGANEDPRVARTFSTFRANAPQLYVDVNRQKAEMLSVPVGSVFESLQVFLGSVYVNDFNFLGRTYRVTAQADYRFRDDEDDIYRLRARSTNGSLVPLGSVAEVKRYSGPDRVVRYNLFPAADVRGAAKPGVSTGQALDALEEIAEKTLPQGVEYQWTDLAFQERQAGNTSLYVFPLCVMFVFLALAAQYESWLLPLAIVLIVPLCLLFAILGVWLRGMDNNLLTQIGFVVLIALACKNAILIVEFAKTLEDEGKSRFEAAVEACRLRLRAILMTAFSFILGTLPLLMSTGAGSEMRRALGTAVFSGMLGVTIVGLLMTPVFYVSLRRFAPRSDETSE